jgi:uncharacterized Zn finger protein (UPF0148 family)
MPTQTLKLTCGQCGFENEPERVYCHNCGSKLDRSVLPKLEEQKKEESVEEARKRVAKMTNPSATSLAREIWTFCKTVGAAALCASLILVARQPDGVPGTKMDMLPRMISMEIHEALNSPQPKAIAFAESEVNAHLLKTVKAKEGVVPGVQFKRMYVNFLGGNALRTSTEQSLWGYPIHSGMTFRIGVVEGKFRATCEGGNFGRLRVHPLLMEQVDFAFQKLWASLKREREQMDRMQAVIVDKERISFVTKGAAR